MNLDELEEKTKASFQEIVSLAERISGSANAAESMHQRVVKEYLRERLIADIEKEVCLTRMNIAENEETQRQNLTIVQDVRVQALWSKKEYVLICTVKMKMWSEPEVIQSKNPLLRSVPAKEFKKRLEILESSIRRGEMDTDLRISPQEVIWIHIFNK